MKTLYISDLDGTLLNKNAQLTDRSAGIISGLIDRGMLFTVATARSLSSLPFGQKLGIKIPCVQLNGVLMYDFGLHRYAGRTAIDPADARAVLEILRRYDRMSFVYKSDEEYGIHVQFEELKNDVEREFFEARKDQDYKSFAQVDNITAGDDENIIYFTMVDEYSRLKPICDELKKISGLRPTLYSDNYSPMYFLEVFSSRATKARGMLEIKRLVGADRVVAFGDNLNDLEMLAQADVGIAVGDAVEEVRKAADLVIGNSFEDGVAEYLEEELRCRFA